METTWNAKRLNQEKAALAVLKCYNNCLTWYPASQDGSTVASCSVKITTTSRKEYWVLIKLYPGYPAKKPNAYVVSPLPLLGHRGIEVAKQPATHQVYTKWHMQSPGDHGEVQICHFHPDAWTAYHTIYKVVLKCRVWLEAFDNHCRTGISMEDALGGAASHQSAHHQN